LINTHTKMEGLNNQRETYLKFYSLSNHSKVRYYEDYVKENPYLTIEEKIELEVEYVYALFEIGKYEKVLENIDCVIEKVIFENIENHNGQDAYLGLLFKKAASYYNLEKYDQCISLAKQLIKIKPNIPLYNHLYYLANKKKKYLELSIINNLGILAVLCGMVLYVVDIFLVDPFLHQYHTGFVYGINALLAIGFGIILYQCIYFLVKKYD
jgi:tetratricopeptide (TPR) repeat protein